MGMSEHGLKDILEVEKQLAQLAMGHSKEILINDNAHAHCLLCTLNLDPREICLEHSYCESYYLIG